MPTIVIPQKMSGTGSIHDLASDLQDRRIKVKVGGYAVVLAAYYGGGTTTHRSWEAALKQSHKNREYSHAIIDFEGYVVEPSGYYNEPKRVSFKPYDVEE